MIKRIDYYQLTINFLLIFIDRILIFIFQKITERSDWFYSTLTKRLEINTQNITIFFIMKYYLLPYLFIFITYALFGRRVVSNKYYSFLIFLIVFIITEIFRII